MMFKKNLTFFFTTILTIGLLMINSGCGKKADEEQASSNLSDSLEAAITSIGGMADEQSGSTFASTGPSLYQNILHSIMNPLPSAYASIGCSERAYDQTCTSNVRMVDYDDCYLGAGLHTLSGSVSLTYSSASCNILSIGDSVTRTYDLVRTTPWGATVTTTSNSRNDYRGHAISGGGKLTHSGALEYKIQIMGKNKYRNTAGGRAAFDVSLRTTSDITLSGSLSRAGRILDGGALEVIHNIGQYTTTIVPNNVTYEIGCCYPVDGSFDVSFSNSSVSGTITFNSCGQATISTSDGVNRDIEFYSCE